MTANYQARRFGIRSALPVSRAWRLADAVAQMRRTGTRLFKNFNVKPYPAGSCRSSSALQAHEEASIDEAYLTSRPQELRRRSDQDDDA